MATRHRAHQLLPFAMLLSVVAGLRPTPAALPTVQTRATNGGVAQLGQRVTISCHLLRPGDAVLVRLLRRPLTGGTDAEVFVAANAGRGALRPPWKSRRDATFSAKTAELSFNMTSQDEGNYGCLALTLDGPSDGGRVQLLTAMAPSEPQLFVNSRLSVVGTAKKTNPIELVEGQVVTVRCNANVGKPPGSLILVDLGKRVRLNGDVRTWTGPLKSGSSTLTVYSSVTYSIRVGLANHGARFGCHLKPHPMFGHLNVTFGVRSEPISVLYSVRRIELRPYRDNYFHGDRIECLAEGRPRPTIRWSRIQGAGQLQTNGSILYMQPGAKEGYYAYTCTAANQVRGRYHRLLQSIGFHLHNQTISKAGPTKQPPPPQAGGPGVRTKVKHWVRRHHRGISVFLITFGVICGFALIAVVFAYLYSTAMGGSGTAYGRLRDSPEDRMRFYGDSGNGGGGGGGIGYCDSSDEDDGSASQPLNKPKETNWIGTPL